MVFQDYALWPPSWRATTSLSRPVAAAFPATRRAPAPPPRCSPASTSRGSRGATRTNSPEASSGWPSRALVADTGLLLCDEPLSNLDADLRDRMRIEISSLVREVGATTI
jgi:iron(III) transport system ATP-binding protein